MQRLLRKSRSVGIAIAAAMISGVVGVGGASALTASESSATLTPQIVSVTPNPFNPRSATTWFRVHVPAEESVSFAIQNTNGQTVQGPHAPGLLAAANYWFQWNGKTNKAKIARDDTYTIAVTAIPAIDPTMRLTATATVRVDTTPPRLTHVTGIGSTIYPFCSKCGSTTFRPKITVNESGQLWLMVYVGNTLFAAAQPHARTGTFQLTWSPRGYGEQVVPAGAYKFFFTALDSARNRRTTPNYIVHVSYKRSP
jgi:hypothetical protein